MIAAFDIDGTIANTAHRHQLAVEKRWDDFHALAPKDKPIIPTVMVLQGLHMLGHRIELWTARPERYRGITEGWLSAWHIPYHELLMRPDNDWRRAYIVKTEWFMRRNPAPQIIFEDHPETTRILRDAGAVVHQVSEGHYSP